MLSAHPDADGILIVLEANEAGENNTRFITQWMNFISDKTHKNCKVFALMNKKDRLNGVKDQYRYDLFSQYCADMNIDTFWLSALNGDSIDTTLKAICEQVSCANPNLNHFLVIEKSHDGTSEINLDKNLKGKKNRTDGKCCS